MSVTELESKITDLECKLAFQEDTVDQLNDTVIQQQKQIETLVNYLQKMQAQITSLQEDNSVMPVEQEPPPPHY